MKERPRIILTTEPCPEFTPEEQRDVEELNRAVHALAEVLCKLSSTQALFLLAGLHKFHLQAVTDTFGAEAAKSIDDLGRVASHYIPDEPEGKA